MREWSVTWKLQSIIIVFGCPLTRNINRIKQESRKGLTHCRPRVFQEFDKLALVPLFPADYPRVMC